MPPTLTVQQLLQFSSTKKINPLDTELIIAHVLKKPREFLIAHPEYEVESYKVHKVIKFIKLRSEGVPLAYITGHKEFFGLDFEVNKNTLIPRPETELMVELAIDKIKKLKDLKIILIDVGTGSGCIPISILKNLHTYLPTHLQTFATDISKQALAVAKKNAKKHHAKIKFLQGDLLSPIIKTLKLYKLYNFQLVVTANLPYLTPQQFKEEPSIQHEPKSALIAGKDGLKFYRQLLKQLSILYKLYNFINFITFIEIDPIQTSSIKLLIKKSLPEAKIIIHKDLAGKNRVVEISSPLFIKRGVRGK